MRVIRVPKVTRKAFDKNRPASDLLRRQVAQLEHVVEVTRGADPVTLSAKKVKTEGQAAQFIAAATRALHIEPPAPVPPPAAPPTSTVPSGAAGTRVASPGRPPAKKGSRPKANAASARTAVKRTARGTKGAPKPKRTGKSAVKGRRR